MKGQARKAKTKAAAEEPLVNPNSTITIQVPNHNDSLCYHGQVDVTPDLCVQFVTEFFQLYAENVFDDNSSVDRLDAVTGALNVVCRKYPEVVNNEKNILDVVKKSIIGNGASFLLRRRKGTKDLEMCLGCAIVLMYIDSYTPFSPIPAGQLDFRDAKGYMVNIDIMNGCYRSLVKFFVNQIPCKCLDKLYNQLRISATPKMGMCSHCRQMKERSSLFVCTGCERTTYCSKACQISAVPEHKFYCKSFQRYDSERAFNQQSGINFS